jgi:hypothetical protein
VADWHFFQGVRGEWRWYRLDELGAVVHEGRRGHAELTRCMDDARKSGWRDSEFAVHARSSLPQFPRRRQGAGTGMVERRRAVKGRARAGAYTGVERRGHGSRDATNRQT